MAAQLTLIEVRKRLYSFVKTFKEADNEQRQAAIFWTRFYECYGIRAEESTIYEQAVRKLDGSRGRIDSFIPGKLIIEHKSKGKNLDSAYEQASEYFLALASKERPKYIITSDFAHIRLYDLAKKQQHECSLQELPEKAEWFRFLLDDEEVEITEETPINREAAYQVSKIHEALLRAKFKGRDLEIFMTRLLFCMFADDTKIFGENNLLRKLIESTRVDGADLGAKLTELFGVFDQATEDRQTNLDDTLAAFPYVNGELFKERTRIPAFDSELRQLLIDCARLDWTGISPAIFGAMFQGVLEEHEPDNKRQATRRELGAHYTSERHILRVINPLFMDDLRAELASAGRNKAKLEALYNKLHTLRFFDPACGCGNFLVIAYRELRRLEFALVELLFDFKKSKGLLDISTVCKVQLDQFYGIEIDEAAVHIARVALYITDHQLNTEAAQRFGETRPTIPLTHTPNIVCGNAITTDWNTVLPASQCHYVMSNPPFYGKQYQTAAQKADLTSLAGKVKGFGVLDYVTCWYFKAAAYIEGHPIHVAFVSTNSITQGEQVSVLWRGLAKYKLSIHFAHRSFKWENEGKGNAAVHCVIIGFSQGQHSKCRLFSYENGIENEPVELTASAINPYLVDASWIVLENRRQAIMPCSEIVFGSMPNDGGHLLLNREEKENLLAQCPAAGNWVRRLYGSEEFINNIERYCLWLRGISPKELRAMPEVLKRVEAVRQTRLNSTREATQKLANSPTLFGEIRQPETGSYLLIPGVSSEQRLFIPIGFLDPEIISSNLALIIPNATLSDFAVLTSTMHMAWTRTVCGRLESRYRYSAGIVYNNFIWPNDLKPTQRAALEKTGQGILDARAKYPEASLADLYDPRSMPPDLLKAHTANDKAVDKAYGYKGGADDAARVAFLFKLYEEATSLLPKAEKKRKPRAKAQTTHPNSDAL